MKNRNKGMGKAIWKGIRYLHRDSRIYREDCFFDSGTEWWDYWNGQKTKRYSYKWVCEWINCHPDADVWQDLFQADPYLKKLCELNKVSLYDQLLFYGSEWYDRK